MKYNRFEELRRNSTKLAKYRVACRLFHELGIDLILLELGKSKNVIGDEGNPIDLCALEHQRTLGFQECLEQIFSLDVQIPGEEALPRPDFGALQKMIEDGIISEEDAELLSQEFEQ